MNTADLIPAGLDLAVLPPRSRLHSVQGAALALTCEEYDSRLAEIQRFRGGIYLADGAIPASALDDSGRHRTVFDEENWHLFITTPDGALCACIRLRLYGSDVSPRDLKVYELVERMSEESRLRFTAAIEQIILESRRQELLVGEVGGWAVREDMRMAGCGVVLPFAVWAHYQIIGDCLIFSAATTRHRSARILKRSGGFPLLHEGRPLPSFYDPFYQCNMELLAYDSRKPAPRFAPLVEQMKERLLRLGVREVAGNAERGMQNAEAVNSGSNIQN